MRKGRNLRLWVLRYGVLGIHDRDFWEMEEKERYITGLSRVLGRIFEVDVI